MKLSDYGLCSENGQIAFASTGGRRKKAEYATVIVHLMGFGMPAEDAGRVYNELKQEAMKGLSEHYSGPSLEEVITNLNPFKDFKVYYNIKSKTSLVYYVSSHGAFPVCLAKDFDKKQVQTVLAQQDIPLYERMMNELPSAINAKAPALVSALDSLEICFNVLTPEIKMPRINISAEPHPAVIEGCNVPALNTIPFHMQDVTLANLNPLLAEFLSRVDNHENMLANFWTNLIGIKTASLIYLKGVGNDGKSAFVKMLGNISGSVCNYDWSERFNYFNMFGKSLIIMNENKMPNILQHTVLKAITGGDFVQIEAKGKSAFSAEVRGQLIIVANDDLKTLGTPDEARRLRYYQVIPHNLTHDKIMGPDEYLNAISSTQNEFLNYMRLCYEKQKTISGLVAEPPKHLETIKALRDYKSSEIFDKIIDKLINVNKSHTFEAQGDCEVYEILELVEEIDKKNKYAQQNFEALLAADYGVVRKMNKYVGLCKKERL